METSAESSICEYNSLHTPRIAAAPSTSASRGSGSAQAKKLQKIRRSLPALNLSESLTSERDDQQKQQKKSTAAPLQNKTLVLRA